uniref:Uncharacterized protein n=1 Tax=Haptolina brevifila TaxID=156173 RepID=A0A7S2CW39_9EUKA|mmetsp:Transcript_28802/g.57969  ORF Transcript_28802/g.57969 Transcript_28802/m.57969 type:complete len:116 (+) Transcript_28802:161-508(+)
MRMHMYMYMHMDHLLYIRTYAYVHAHAAAFACTYTRTLLISRMRMPEGDREGTISVRSRCDLGAVMEARCQPIGLAMPPNAAIRDSLGRQPPTLAHPTAINIPTNPRVCTPLWGV